MLIFGVFDFIRFTKALPLNTYCGMIVSSCAYVMIMYLKVQNQGNEIKCIIVSLYCIVLI